MIQSYLDKAEYDTSAAELFAKKYIEDYMTRMLALSEQISSYALVKNGKAEIWTEIQFSDQYSEKLKNTWYENIKEENADIMKTPVVSKPYLFTYRNQNGVNELHYISISITQR